MSELKRTVLYSKHLEAGAKMIDFGGWEMPVQYSDGIITEHLRTRKAAGLFDVSHMGRFLISGKDALSFLQHVLTNNAEALEPGFSQYTIIQTGSGGAVDDAYLYRFNELEWMLVVNASNRQKDWKHFQKYISSFSDVSLRDESENIAIISLQGPLSGKILEKNLTGGQLPEPVRNALSEVSLSGVPVKLARTGYTGEPVCFEIFTAAGDAGRLWDLFVTSGAVPVGLGARDTLRLEAGLPLYGHELGIDSSDEEIPIFASGLAGFAVSFSPLKGDFIGRSALEVQHSAKKKIIRRDYSQINDLPKIIRCFALTGKGLARAGAEVYQSGRKVGWVTSGTSVPYWVNEGVEFESAPGGESSKRSIGLAYIDSDILNGEFIEVDVRGRMIPAVVVQKHLSSKTPPYSYPVLAELSD